MIGGANLRLKTSLQLGWAPEQGRADFNVTIQFGSC